MGGTLAGTLCIVVAVVLFLTEEESFFGAFFPILFITILGLAMRGTPPSGMESFLSMTLGIILQILMYFVIGVVIGLLVQKAKNKYLKMGIVLLVLLSVPGLMMKIKIQERQLYNKTFHVGLSLEDCEKQNSPSERANCYGDVYDRFAPSPVICEKIGQGDSDYYECARYVGEKSGNLDLCKKFDEQAAIDGCIAFIPKFSKTDAACNQINDTRTRDYCLYNAGITTKQYSYCEKMKNIDSSVWWTKADCIFSIAMVDIFNCNEKAGKDFCMLNICNSLTDEKAQVNCYLNIAAQLHNASYCDFISDAKDRNGCNSFIQQNPSQLGKRVIIKAF